VKKELSDYVIRSVIDDLISLKTGCVYLSGGGEPTTVRNWADYAKQLMSSGIEVALITNGAALKKSHLNILRNMNYIAISIYSDDEKECSQITGGRSFNKQFDLPSMIKHKENHAVVGARCVLNSVNHRRIVSIYKKAMNANFDYIIFIPSVDYEDANISLSPDEMDTVRDILKEYYGFFDLSRTNIDSLLDRKIRHYEPVDYRRDFLAPPAGCSAVSIRGNAFINYDGGVYLCQPRIGDARFCIGNVTETQFKKIWNSRRHFEIIDTLNGQFAAGLCKNCRSINFNKAADAYDKNPSLIADITEDVFI
jgi:radical SAM protein with 4Fe4S-binding SPASM domain